MIRKKNNNNFSHFLIFLMLLTFLPFVTLFSLSASQSMTQLEIAKRNLKDFPKSIQQNIDLNPYLFLKILRLVEANTTADTQYLDKNHPLPNAESYLPKNLVSLDSTPIRTTRKGIQLTKETAEALIRLNQRAKDDGFQLIVGSGYRSYQYQIRTYNRWVQLLGEEKADRLSAKAGTSQHQLGTTFDFYPIDIAFNQKPECAWLYENAWKEGFSLSYPENQELLTGYEWEPWHYRYLGKEMLLLQRHFFNDSQYYLLKWWNLYQKDRKKCNSLLK